MAEPLTSAGLRCVTLVSVCASLLGAGVAFAGDDEPAEIPPPPEGWDFKRPLSRADYRRKKQDSYITGLPLANFDPSTGFGGGVRGYYYFNGPRSHPLFGYTPYLHRVFAQYFRTTRGLQFHWLDYDAPAIGGSPYRLRAQLIYLRNTQQYFFGTDDAAMAPLTFTGAGRSFGDFSNYERALRRVRPDGTTLARYDHYDLIRPIAIIGFERTFLHGLIRPLIGFGFTHTTINDYSGALVEEAIDEFGNEVTAPMGTTRLAEYCAADRLVGCGGGWDNFIRLGISYDTRDFEPDPNSGIFADAALDLGTKLLGGRNYARLLFALRGYYSPIPDHADLVLAARGTFQMQSQGVPFFSLNTIPYTEDPRTGLGGIRTLRGFKQDRFIGHTVALLNLEARWTFYRFRLYRQKFALIAAAFIDTGRVFDEASDFTLRGWRTGTGAALRIAWNQATIVTADYGISAEDTGLYINFNHIF